MQKLAPYSAYSEYSRGRQYTEDSPSYRSEYQRDRDRIVHSVAFRRLEYKTQVFVNHEGDLFRTRLTHSIEVAQIARSIARELDLNEDLTEAISLAHDLGHTPFGHSGQDTLNACMKDYGGFEHNLQSLRVVDVLEQRYAEFQGINLTFETREGILKHCSKKNAAELGDVGQRFLRSRQPGLEAQLANLADSIAYNNHDVDDGLRGGLITVEQLREIRLFAIQCETVSKIYPQLDTRRMINETVRRMINYLVVDLIETSRARLLDSGVSSIDEVRNYPEPILMHSDAVAKESLELKRFLQRNLYEHYRVLRMSKKAGRVINKMFQAFMEDYRILPTQYHELSAELPDNSESMRARIVADYIAGMTDRFAINEYRRLFEPGELT
ncbi:deoxyguanosinetriphosphate triphosphohydrolase [bacterium BMS3Abin11]|nr:deoxyguanosinetriphosphate triphosphohydrolase [bacterium BMS3Abin11]GMT39949.1 MAG: deoxyguanosinetriphosphate triphosphohydrolase-like protein [bacterium]HDZ78826.1 deoxyguanosinetriphosphate triphosphohydrolase [Gammaproteobacteria bacterium]